LRELILTQERDKLRAYLLEHHQLVEFYELGGAVPYSLGDIFLGRVTQVVRGLNAAFVDIGLAREGFLHYSDLGPSFPLQQAFLRNLRRGHWNPSDQVGHFPPPAREANIADYVQVGDWILVQVVKEMSETKGPRLSAQVGLTGQALVLLPFSAEIGVSHRISDPALRAQWKEHLRQMYRSPYGIVLRTQGQYLSPPEVAAEYERLIQRWEAQLQALLGKHPPYRLFGDNTPFSTLLHELLSPPPQVIHAVEAELHQKVCSYLEAHPLPVSPQVRLGLRKTPFTHAAELDRLARQLLGRTVTLPNGGYLVIEHTEALHVIDVNSGSLAAQGKLPEETILQTNLLAAHEVARQLRLRDMGGIIVVDFIDMRQPEHRQLVYERLREAMKADRAKHAVLPMSEFGLVQITRQRRRLPVELPEEHRCPTCKGSGRLAYPGKPLEEMQAQIRHWGAQYPKMPLTLRVHPSLLAYWRSVYPAAGYWIWNLLPHRWLRVEPSPEVLPLRGLLLDPAGRPLAEVG